MLTGDSLCAAGHRWRSAVRLALAGILPVILAARAPGAAPQGSFAPRVDLTAPLVVTRLPAATDADRPAPDTGGTLPAPPADRARLVLVYSDRPARVLSRGFYGARDPDVSFDGSRILFSGKRSASDPWNIYEVALDGSNLRQITKDLGDCRSPGYQPTLYTIVSPQPWYQLTFVSNAAGTLDEYGATRATHHHRYELP